MSVEELLLGREVAGDHPQGSGPGGTRVCLSGLPKGPGHALES